MCSNAFGIEAGPHSLKITLSNNHLHTNSASQTIGKALFAAYTKGVAENRPYQLHHFILGRSRLEDPGITQIARALQAGS
jgi:hypothetical protein